MKIVEIDKTIYRQRLNRVIIGFIVVLTLLSLVFGTALIATFSEPITEAIVNQGSEDTSNFKYNFSGVVLALLSCAAILHYLKTTPFFYEIYYVWQMKQIHNVIYRKLKKIKKAAFQDHNQKAMIILNFYYTSLHQIYVLDDNTLTLSSLMLEQQQLNELMLASEQSIDIEQFNKKLIAEF
ncbi:DUF3087 family protein [Colwellia sp. 1_MG-2023]|uniref:DUF3087 family protein n=1 Tax=Colwellia sp. 1_MG-2023 TaxID=3062649 RepID=UPI0026E30CA0|nr:DUF3087 family protein [Colwellia sp. 1_MG-2023]MDO6447298.1 DUF3087 family protein [Colwellia sp. 1_MG-2023]